MKTTMPNYRPKDAEYMRELARRGGEKSGETRRKKKALKKILVKYAGALGIDLEAALACTKAAKRRNCSGGSHDTDWRCPYCRHFNSIKRHLCAKCGRRPRNGRLTRAALRERAEWHRMKAILRKHEL